MHGWTILKFLEDVYWASLHIFWGRFDIWSKPTYVMYHWWTYLNTTYLPSDFHHLSKSSVILFISIVSVNYHTFFMHVLWQYIHNLHPKNTHYINTFLHLLRNTSKLSYDEFIKAHFTLKGCDIVIKCCPEGVTKGANLSAIGKVTQLLCCPLAFWASSVMPTVTDKSTPVGGLPNNHPFPSCPMCRERIVRPVDRLGPFQYYKCLSVYSNCLYKDIFTVGISIWVKLHVCMYIYIYIYIYLYIYCDSPDNYLN